MQCRRTPPYHYLVRTTNLLLRPPSAQGKAYAVIFLSRKLQKLKLKPDHIASTNKFVWPIGVLVSGIPPWIKVLFRGKQKFAKSCF